MSLPLLARATPDGLTFALTRRNPSAKGSGIGDQGSQTRSVGSRIPDSRSQQIPARMPAPGEQYRFHFDMGKCIGCKSCVVACNEQNGNPAAINWRRVGEIEGGWFPSTTRSYLSMGCNHCLEPSCLEGCPVDAYVKDPVTGIVRHSADACIGCQYCTWNCSYGVPQYNAERGVVGKCDMCHGRLSIGQLPACVSACPENAIQIEIVSLAAWKASTNNVRASGVPFADPGVSTTRITLPDHLPPNAQPRDMTHVVPEQPHWPLVVMTVLTQLSVGAFATIWLLHLLGAFTRLDVAALTSLILGGLALTASTLHLGRPIHAYRALRMWRRSWLSREVLLFGCFSGVATVYAAALWFGLPGGRIFGGLTTLFGIAGITASACIYRVPARPAWNTPYTLVQFNVTAAILGPLFVAATGAGGSQWLAIAAASAAGAQFVLLALRFFGCIASDRPELRGTARLLSTVFARRFVLRGVLLALGAVVLPIVGVTGPPKGGPYEWIGGGGPHAWIGLIALACALAGEILGRYLFFVTVVPTNMATPYLPSESEAA